MPSCEMCGKRAEFLNKAIVEGVMLSVCNDCSEFGKAVKIEKPVIEEEKPLPRPIRTITTEFVDSIVNDYASIIKNAREKMDLKQKEVAQRIAEKESVIHNIETGHLEPSIKLARKLEQFFRIRLVEQIEEKREKQLDLRSTNLTIGDLLKIKK
ncbi:MAG: TIGR00270 family protein [Nanoarchaeota archaeon]|nr:TIGR00270 family protein [Nanoarchaeota archaeon]